MAKNNSGLEHVITSELHSDLADLTAKSNDISAVKIRLRDMQAAKEVLDRQIENEEEHLCRLEELQQNAIRRICNLKL